MVKGKPDDHALPSAMHLAHNQFDQWYNKLWVVIDADTTTLAPLKLGSVMSQAHDITMPSFKGVDLSIIRTVIGFKAFRGDFERRMAGREGGRLGAAGLGRLGAAGVAWWCVCVGWVGGGSGGWARPSNNSDRSPGRGGGLGPGVWAVRVMILLGWQQQAGSIELQDEGDGTGDGCADLPRPPDESRCRQPIRRSPQPPSRHLPERADAAASRRLAAARRAVATGYCRPAADAAPK
ncbi:hypothetical protein T492DRAFT_1125912 [Pavlovales sp. CCMP2436]|nr:hypothetical protein T492DRAFT_1125912 [Pavlovales sp. CCMP2436]